MKIYWVELSVSCFTQSSATQPSISIISYSTIKKCTIVLLEVIVTGNDNLILVYFLAFERNILSLNAPWSIWHKSLIAVTLNKQSQHSFLDMDSDKNQTLQLRLFFAPTGDLWCHNVCLSVGQSLWHKVASLSYLSFSCHPQFSLSALLLRTLTQLCRTVGAWNTASWL